MGEVEGHQWEENMSKKVFIVVPCYNESEVLHETLSRVLELGRCDVVVVDDGSRVPAINYVRGLPVHYLRHCINLGQGAALQTGMTYALEQGADIVIHFDGDGQHRVEDIPRFIEALEDCDVVVGSRFLRQEDTMKVPVGKRILLKTARVVNFFFTGLWLSDAHNGYRALGRKALEKIDLQENRMAHATEIVGQIRRLKLKVRELPVTIDYTEYSKAKGQKWYNSINILIDLIISKIF